jgi:hypothetical protein
MNFPPLDLLRASNESSAFTLLLWQELFGEETPDTFRPRHQNIPALVREIREVAALAIGHSSWLQHLTEVKDELTVAIKESMYLLTPFPRYLWALNDLLTFSEPRQIELQTQLLTREVPTEDEFYQGNLMRALKEMPRGKENLVIALNNLATFAASSGRRREDLMSLASDTSFAESVDEVVGRLCAICNLQEDNYRFVAAIEGDHRQVAQIVERYRPIALLRLNQRPTTQGAQEFFARNQTRVLVTGQVEAAGPVDAAKFALRAVRPMADLLNFFNNGLSLGVREEVLVIRTDGTTESIEIADQSLQRLVPRNRALALTIRALRQLPNQLRGRLLNALELHSLAQGSAAPRVRLVNLWTALECLLGTRKADSIIAHAASLIGPLMAWNRVAKMTKYLAISLHQFARYGELLPRNSGFNHSTPHEVKTADLLAVLSKPYGHPHPSALATYTAPHVLLRYRLFLAWHSFSEPAVLREELRKSQKRVRWQLFRIYRARNMSVHHGDDVQMSSTLLDTLHYYFSVLLSRIVDSLGRNPNWQLDEAVASLSREARYVEHNLQRSPHVLVIRDFLPDTRVRATENVWDAANEA